MKKYIDGVDSITGVRRNTARFAEVLGSSTAISSRTPSAISKFVVGMRDSSAPDVKDGIGTLAGAAAGALLWKEHRVLGFIGGASIGRNVPAALLHPDERRSAVCNMLVTGAAVAGSLYSKNHPVWGFVLAGLAGGAVVHFTGLRK